MFPPVSLSLPSLPVRESRKPAARSVSLSLLDREAVLDRQGDSIPCLPDRATSHAAALVRDPAGPASLSSRATRGTLPAGRRHENAGLLVGAVLFQTTPAPCGRPAPLAPVQNRGQSETQT
jgi:hypothetical protein